MKISHCLAGAAAVALLATSAPALRPAASAAHPDTSRQAPPSGNVEGTYGTIPARFANPDWGTIKSTQDTGATYAQRWSYADYPMNCLPDSTTGPAYKFLSVRSQWTGEDYTGAGAPVNERRPVAFRSTVRRAISIYAASVPNMALNSTTKPQDHTPRIITFQDSTGNCQPLVETVHVPRPVLQREPYQAWDHDGDPSTPRQLGLWPWLEVNGFNQPNRRYITFVTSSDVRSFYTSNHHPGGLGAALALGRWAANGLLDERPGADNRCQDGGVAVVDISMNDRAWNDNGSGGSLIAHELMHSLCGPITSAPHWSSYSGGHVSDCYDLMGYCQSRQGWARNEDGTAQCGRATFPDHYEDSNRGNQRFDCAGDDYWGPLSSTTHRSWNTRRYSAWDNRFLWGAPNTSNRDFDMAALGIPPECTYDPAYGYCPPGVTPGGQ